MNDIIFSPKNENTGAGNEGGVDDKKIEYSQKLPSDDIEGKVARKGNDFNFVNQEGSGGGESTTPRPINLVDSEDSAGGGEGLWNRLKNTKLGGGNGEDIKTEKDFLEVNLIKGEIVKYFNWQKGILIMAIYGFVSAAILSFALWGITWWGSSQQQAQNQEEIKSYKKIEDEISKREGQLKDVMLLKDKIDLVTYLVDNHIYWNNFFKFLEKNILGNVSLSGFSGSTNGNYTLTATTDGLEFIDAQVKELLKNKEYVTRAEASDVSFKGEQGKQFVNFSLSFSVDPKIFSMDPESFLK